MLARFYFAEGDEVPVLREEDRDRDGRPDRWIVYRGDERSEVLEDNRGDGSPDVRWLFGPGGSEIARIEVDLDIEGRARRVLHYEGGRLVAEERDLNGDGRFDRRDTFDASGQVMSRAEDLTGDGSIDVVSRFRGGRDTTRTPIPSASSCPAASTASSTSDPVAINTARKSPCSRFKT